VELNPKVTVVVKMKLQKKLQKTVVARKNLKKIKIIVTENADIVTLQIHPSI
jgi:hypothetical protein